MWVSLGRAFNSQEATTEKALSMALLPVESLLSRGLGERIPSVTSVVMQKYGGRNSPSDTLPENSGVQAFNFHDAMRYSSIRPPEKESCGDQKLPLIFSS